MISVIIPCYNEQNTLKKSTEKIFKYFENKKIDYEIIFINNASTDNTLHVLNDLSKDYKIIILDEPKKGKGNAVKKGLLNATFDKVLIIDADLSTDINELKEEWLSLENIMLIGSRYLGNEIKTPFLRRLSGFILNSIIRFFFKTKIRDTQCGFKFISSKDIYDLSMELSIEGFMYDLDLIYSCFKKSIDVVEIPIKYIFHSNSSVSLLRDPVVMLIDMLTIRKKFRN